VAGVDSTLLSPRNTWEDKQAYDSYLAKLVEEFGQNFAKYDVSDEIKNAGPNVSQK
jgi:phosphoenolpyruvate carboxykinase (ATP)